MEFVSYLPPNTQAALIQPIGSQGVLVLGSDTQRGFSRLDQVGGWWGWWAGRAGGRAGKRCAHHACNPFCMRGGFVRGRD